MEPIRLGLLGLNFGEGIARHIVKNVPQLSLRAVCDLDVARANRVAESIGVSVRSLDELLTDPEIEAVALFTGPVERPALLEKVLNAGRHVITTKPFALDSKAAERVLRLAHEKRLVVHLNSPGPEKAADQVLIDTLQKEHNLGRPVAFHAETWAHYREKANGTWYDDPEKCPAAPILRLGVYFLNDFVPAIGVPDSLSVLESRLFTERPTSDQAQISLHFSNGAIGSIFASFCVDDGQPYRDNLTINFVNGTIRRWMVRTSGSTMESDYAKVSLQVKGKAPVEFETKSGEFAGWYQWSTFQEAIRNKKGTTVEQIESVLFGVRLLEATRESSRTGQPIRLTAL